MTTEKNSSAIMSPTAFRSAITLPALIKRINRVLKQDDQILRKTRGIRARLDLGDYYVHDYRRNLALDTHVDPEAYGREVGILRDREAVAED